MPSPHPSDTIITMDDLIDELLVRLEDMQHAENVAKLHQLEEESLGLERDLHLACEQRLSANALLKETTKLLQITFGIARAYDKKKAYAERGWRIYWGIEQQRVNAVFEMECIDAGV
jgi:hypothetical protein